MNRFVTGFMAGGITAAIGVSYVMSDTRMRKKVLRNSRKVLDQANQIKDTCIGGL